MISIKKLRKNKESFQEKLALKQDNSDMGLILSLDEKLRELKTISSEMRAERNSASEAIGQAKKTGLDAKEICHIGDHPINDVKASLDFGMTPIWFNNEKIDFPLEGIEVNEFSDWHSLPDLIKKL